MAKPRTLLAASDEARRFNEYRRMHPELNTASRDQVFRIFQTISAESGVTQYRAQLAREYYRANPVAVDGKAAPVRLGAPIKLTTNSAEFVARYEGLAFRLVSDAAPLGREECRYIEDVTGTKRATLYRIIKELRRNVKANPLCSVYKNIQDLHRWAFNKGYHKEMRPTDADATGAAILKMHSEYPFNDPDATK